MVLLVITKGLEINLFLTEIFGFYLMVPNQTYKSFSIHTNTTVLINSNIIIV